MAETVRMGCVGERETRALEALVIGPAPGPWQEEKDMLNSLFCRKLAVCPERRQYQSNLSDGFEPV